ncbi:MAG TPA: Uma2 family endonuclease [Candidatus Ventrimonas merdavium]|nr:Uma2 family endonuclease [Candidatus Ventrimonas merdavium]
MIEIVSAGSKRIDYMVKLFKYRNAGVREYWIVDPLKSRILVYDFKMDDLNEYTFTDKVPSSIYKNLVIDFSVL